MTAGRGLFSLLPPAFAAVPQYSVHITVVPKPLSEPDKRISHTYGSSVSHSVSLHSTTGVQVFADFYGGPVELDKSPFKLVPGVAAALALAVEPFEQDLSYAGEVVVAPCRVIRDGVVVQVADHSGPRLPDHLPFAQYTSRFACPVREISQTLAQLLAAGSTFHLEVALSGFPAVVREAQEGEVRRFFASLTRVLASKSPELDAVRFFLS